MRTASCTETVPPDSVGPPQVHLVHTPASAERLAWMAGTVNIIDRDLDLSDANVIPTYACNGLSVSVIYGQPWDVTWRWRAQTGWTEIKGAPSAEP